MSVEFPIRRRPVRWLAGFLFWTLIVLFYSTSSGMMGRQAGWTDSLKSAMTQWYVWALLAPLIIRVDRLLPVAREAPLRRVIFHIPLSFLFTGIYIYASALARTLLGVTARGSSFSFSFDVLRASWRGAFHWNLLVYWVIVGVYVAYDYYSDLKERQLRTAELERLLAESHLNALQTQLHPHFLFNALNTISAHVERDPRTARRMLEQLGELLRLSLDHSEDQEIPLEQELAFLERYLDIQKVRFEDRLDVATDVLNGLVPTFVLQPLVENAIRHGIAPRSAKGSVEVAAWRDNGRLRLRVRDDGPGLPRGWDPAHNQGVGISNTRERLRRLYGDAEHTFEITGEPGAGVRVDLSFPFRDAPRQLNGDYPNTRRR
jgi:two-component system LytT family sensor kinase